MTPSTHDFGSLHQALLQVLYTHFGRARTNEPILRPYMRGPAVQAAISRVRSTRRRLNRAIRRGHDDARLISLRGDLQAAGRALVLARRAAVRIHYKSLLDKIQRGSISIFWFLYRRHRGAAPPTFSEHLPRPGHSCELLP